jgi:DNA polymerase-3 subunit delta
VVLVDGADGFVSANRSELEAYAERPAATGVLVLLVKTWPSNTRLAKIVERCGWSIECKPPKESELAPWLIAMAKVHGGKALEEHAARLLVELAGPDAGILISELEKLITYVGDRPAIERGDVSKMVGTGRVETVWRILDAATGGKRGAALEDLDRLLATGENAVGLLAAMTASLRKVHRAGMLRLRKIEAKEACRLAGIPPFAVNQTLVQHTHLGPARVGALPAMLLRADLDLKGSSQLPPRTILEKLLVELGRPRRD